MESSIQEFEQSTNVGLRRRQVIEVGDLSDIARGAAFLGAGGGGDPYIGYLVSKCAILEFGSPTIIPLDELDDDATVVSSAMIGAPTVTTEKIVSGDDAVRAVHLMEETIGRNVDAIISGEIGGVNSLLPVMTAARMGLPVVDADGCGRAVPGINMTVWNAANIPATPVILVNEHLNTVVIETDDALRAEKITRAAVTGMGLSVMSAIYVMNGKQCKASSVPDTIEIARYIGESIRTPSDKGPIASLLDCLRSTPHYSKCGILATGKIIDLNREITGGFIIGKVRIESEQGKITDLEFQNEHLKAESEGLLLASVPDIISVVDSETAEPIPTEALRFGQRVTVIGASAPVQQRSSQALENCGPKPFGISDEYIEIERLNDWD